MNNIKKKITVVFFVFMLCMSVSHTLFAQENTSLKLNLSTNATLVKPGNSFSVSVNIEEGSNLGALDYQIAYDASQVEFVNYTEGAALSKWKKSSQKFIAMGPVQTSNPLKISLAGTTGMNSSGELGVFTFKAKSNATIKTAGISLAVTSACQEEYGLNAFETGLTSISPAIGTQLDANVLICKPGDIDCNGKVEIADSELAKQIVMKNPAVNATNEGLKAGDLNGDNMITINEAREISRKLIEISK